ncbi:MAG TPA: hypothetical protein EYN28_00140 [Flavobacteriales bacterium]|nr:hypothetical protein [Flavobacteriales bacterium]HHZ94854.1 hypothetical protein [Flavobacteriales bacterium]HIB76078.1 hypothetical protein [Flavobacteriales bacterium]HIN41532.1 hypothetical protein [Flavobacteriales bacterium]HIO16700.1 hypothetical protein [Flavobacteriales bacterium]
MIRAIKILSLMMLVSCGVYSPYGASTSGADTFSVTKFEAIHPLVSATSALNITEAVIARVQRQSVLKLVGANDGELQFSGKIVGWTVQPINVQGDEVAGANRITITVDISYTNTLDDKLSFQRKFSRFVDVPSSSDLFSMEDAIVEEVAELLSQDIFNVSLGNW